MAKIGSKERIRRFLLQNVGKKVTSLQIRDAAGAGISEWARRLRELRDEEGWPIRSKNDDAKLKPNEYRLEGPPPAKHDVSFARSISKKLSAEVRARNGFTCQHCGLGPDQIDPATGRKTRLHIGHIVDKSLGGKDELSNLRTLCSTCNEGAKNLTAERPSLIWLKGRIRSATQDDQKAVLKWLKTKFDE
jgi:5-methylcytosine-specific restriction endonuclease McrA